MCNLSLLIFRMLLRGWFVWHASSSRVHIFIADYIWDMGAVFDAQILTEAHVFQIGKARGHDRSHEEKPRTAQKEAQSTPCKDLCCGVIAEINPRVHNNESKWPWHKSCKHSAELISKVESTSSEKCTVDCKETHELWVTWRPAIWIAHLQSFTGQWTSLLC